MSAAQSIEFTLRVKVRLAIEAEKRAWAKQAISDAILGWVLIWAMSKGIQSPFVDVQEEEAST